ncbi:MAG: hypothetical protein KME09_00040 [Pleurocapsa minor HA4230-MV1]|jgi:predicted CopG family antitoxin|nr:hypothetical protein [Pleurocapsa minor HA4230-MV1]
MSKVKKTVTLSSETVERVKEIAKQESRSFSQMLDILVKRQLSDNCLTDDIANNNPHL